MNRASSLTSTVAALAGVAFSALLFLTVASLDPLADASDADLVTWWSDRGNLRDTVLSSYLLLIGAPLFLVFLSQLCQRLRAAGDSAASWTGVAFGAGVAFVALLVAWAVCRSVVAQSVRFSDEPLPGPDTLRFATELAQAVVNAGAMPMAAVTIGCASGVILRTGVLARWLGWLGIVVAVGLLALIAMFVGAFGIPLVITWTVAASFMLWRTRAAVASEARRASAQATA